MDGRGLRNPVLNNETTLLRLWLALITASLGSGVLEVVFKHPAFSKGQLSKQRVTEKYQHDFCISCMLCSSLPQS